MIQMMFTLAFLALVIWLGKLILQSLPDMQRYVRMRNM
ncbi:DUF6893 family small protein [Sulfobacillus thermosulfidooxidans]|uniref:Uncharacterized protein n=1 Tax=Sulfobacillus thermosulfidooxidans (strain DSM 9293 / VKM B-1269 / AT-1) TaxID=929705 RepID=A0A1W1WFA0_SULTA|nr:hypothetical protein SAMN00768000_1802 [Sulfobacillus thermosulfidooxidans DSM 9293]